ncbi:hypothetical protein NORO109296_24310 [Nocardiopsis rhodophaea]
MAPAALRRARAEAAGAVAQQVRREAGAVVAHDDGTALDGDPHRSVPVPVGVDDEVADDPFEAARVGLHGRRGRGGLRVRRVGDGDLGVEAGARHGLGDDRVERDMGADRLFGTGVQPGDLQQVLDQAAQVAHPGPEQILRLTGRQQVGGGQQTTDGCAQLVGHVRGELALGAQPLGETVGHEVDGGGDVGHLVAALGGPGPGIQVPGGDPARGLGDPPQSAGEQPGPVDRQGRGRRECDQ